MSKPPENANAPAGDQGEREKNNDCGTLSPAFFPVKPRFCRPVTAAALAREIRNRLLCRLETGSDFAQRVARTKADAAGKESR